MQFLMGMFNSMKEVERLREENEELRSELDYANDQWSHWNKEYWNERWELADAIEKVDKLEAQLLAERQQAQETTSYQQPYRLFVDRLFVNKRDGYDGLMHMAAGLAGEAGEVLDQVKKVWVYNKHLERQHMVEELGDVFYYLTGLLIVNGITLGEIIDANMTKLKKRYPDGYSDQAAIERKDKAA